MPKKAFCSRNKKYPLYSFLKEHALDRFFPPKSLRTFHGTNHHLARWTAGASILYFLPAECIYFSTSLQEHPCTLDFASLFPKDILLHNEVIKLS